MERGGQLRFAPEFICRKIYFRDERLVTVLESKHSRWVYERSGLKQRRKSNNKLSGISLLE